MIRLAEHRDLPAVQKVYAHARTFMRETGNPTQWGNSYPTRALLCSDIENKRLFVLEDCGKISACFVFMHGPDPTYLKIYDGEWQNDEPYYAIHRVASNGTVKKFFEKCVCFCRPICSHLRIDTHSDNAVMQHVLEKNGFLRCGTVMLDNGETRIAYELC